MFTELLTEAETALREADPLCVEANGIVTESKRFVESATVLWARILFLHDAQADQLQNMGNIYVLLNHTLEQANKQCHKQLKRITKAQADLETLLQGLHDVKIDAAYGEPGRTLHSFVHVEGIDELRAQSTRICDQLRQGVTDLEALPDRLQKELSTLRDRQPPLSDPEVGPLKMVVNDLAELSEKTGPYAHDMAQWLDSLTAHYDLSIEAQTLEDQGEQQEALQVLTADRSQLQPALEGLRTDSQALLEQHRKVKGMLRALQSQYDSSAAFFDRIEAFTSHTLRKYCDNVTERQAACTVLFRNADALCAEMDGLAEYYRLFKKSYYALVLESVRRSQAQAQLKRQINDINTALEAANTREAAARADFISSHGEYLPKDLWPGLDSVPTSYSLQIVDEDVGEVNDESIITASRAMAKR